MLQFMATLYTTTVRHTPRLSWRFTAFIANSSSSSNPVASIKEADSTKCSEIQNNILQKEQQKSKETKTNERIFHSSERKLFSMSDVFSKQFQAAKSINDLLDLATIPNLSTNNALKLISHITNEINSGKSQIVNVEADERFIHLRKIVETDDDIKIEMKQLNEDLSRYSQLSTPAMIAVMASLREEGKRNTPLLRLLSYNIVKYNVKLNLKQCATLLYSMAVLNFPDKVLLEKIMTDLLECIPKSTNAVTNRSIITSLGFLCYKNEDVLDAFCDTLFKESINYKTHDYMSILHTFAALRYKSERINPFIEKFVEKVNSSQRNPIEWLDFVWSLAVLDIVQPRHVESVLEPTFIARLFANSKINVSKILKLININAVAQFVLKDYKGYLLKPDSEAFTNVSLVRAKQKQAYVDALSETLGKLLLSAMYFKTNIDTNMGIIVDAEYHLDADYRLIKVENWNEQSENVKRIAMVVHDYHDYCRGQNDLKGSTYLYTQLLKAQGYNLITISYENFSIQDKIEKQIHYLKQCMKNVHKI